ncbi:hypothetical protein MMC13_006849 [Lambiella insularis]|nr:hypothetical protein [Lambiella insularis]
MYNVVTSFLALALVQLASAQTVHPVTVGQGGQLLFSPNVVSAAVGDKIVFSFFSKNHTVAQSSFAAPCVPINSAAIFAGFQPQSSSTTAGPDTFTVTVNDTSPIWLYCPQGQHCQAGMSMVINQPGPPNALVNYQAAAKNSTTITPITIQGGVFSENLPSGPGSSLGSSATTASSVSTVNTQSSNSYAGSAPSSTAPSGTSGSEPSGSSTATGTTASTTISTTSAATSSLQWGVLGLGALVFSVLVM